MLYSKIVKHMKAEGIKFKNGIEDIEIKKIEKIYDISFPQDLKAFYKTGLPISKGFYNWSDYSDNNIEYIKNIINEPSKYLLENINEVEWSTAWGEEPKNIKDKSEVLKNRIATAPILIPVYLHRYMVSGIYNNCPVISVMGSDVIYYAKNLKNYFDIDFRMLKSNIISYRDIIYIPFWSDIIEN